MATRKNRIAISVTDELNDLLTRLSNLSGQPKYKIILEMVEDTQPYLEEIVKALEMAENAKDSRKPVSLLSDFAKLANEQMSIINNELSNAQEKQDD